MNEKILFALIIAAAVVTVLTTSGCVDNAGDIAEDISEIGEKEHTVTFIKGEKRQVAEDSEYFILLKLVRRDSSGSEAVIEIFSKNVSIGQKTLKTAGADREVKIERMALELMSVDYREEYVEIEVREKVDIIGYGEKAGSAVKETAKAVAESATSIKG